MAMSFTKAHSSALCLVPPRATWETIQRIRCFNDRNFVRWPPHINLLYPFATDYKLELEEAAYIASAALQDMGPFQEIQSQYKPVSFSVDGIEIISRKGHSQPFNVRYRVPFGGQPEEVNIPYIATISEETPSSHPLARRYGLGAVHDGVWYFAYGANMSPAKLTGSRGITPLESLAAKLPGWALAFNHRGAMGNLMKLAKGEQGLGGFTEAHGVLHRLSSHDFALLTAMEHEYRPTELHIYPYNSDKPVTAIAFVSPPERLIPASLPPTSRYAHLLRGGADEFLLETKFRSWLRDLATVPSDQKRGEQYWHDLKGNPMKIYPKIWKGSEQQTKKDGKGGRGGRQGRGGGGRGRRGLKPSA